MQNQNYNIIINKVDIDENALQNFNFESIITLEELLTYFFEQKIKLIKINYISFFKIFHHYQIDKSLNIIFIKEKKYSDLFEKLFKLQFISIILDEIYSQEIKNKNEKIITIIKDCLILNHQNFLILCLILINILQLNNMTNLYHNKINKIIFEKLIDLKSYQANNILNIENSASKIELNNKDIENKIKIIIKDKNLSNCKIIDMYNKLSNIKLDDTIKFCLKILGLNTNEILDFYNSKENTENNQIIMKSVKVPFLTPLKDDDNYILTIVLDLDKTLIYSEEDEENYEEGEEEEDDEIKEQKENIIFRPGLYELLDNLIKLKCELIIFTSSARERSEEIINKIEKNKKYFNNRLYREHCTLMGAAYVKDISKLGRDLSKTIIIDNDLGCFYLQQENGVLIKSFCGEEDDKSLFNLYQILNKIIKNPFFDIRYELDKYKNEIINKVGN